MMTNQAKSGKSWVAHYCQRIKYVPKLHQSSVTLVTHQFLSRKGPRCPLGLNLISSWKLRWSICYLPVKQNWRKRRVWAKCNERSDPLWKFCGENSSLFNFFQLFQKKYIYFFIHLVVKYFFFHLNSQFLINRRQCPQRIYYFISLENVAGAVYKLCRLGGGGDKFLNLRRHS